MIIIIDVCVFISVSLLVLGFADMVNDELLTQGILRKLRAPEPEPAVISV